MNTHRITAMAMAMALAGFAHTLAAEENIENILTLSAECLRTKTGNGNSDLGVRAAGTNRFATHRQSAERSEGLPFVLILELQERQNKKPLAGLFVL
jgi:hypothetical protein